MIYLIKKASAKILSGLLGGNGTPVTATTPFLVYIDSGGNLASAPIQYDVGNNKLVSSVTIEVPPATIQVGEGMELSAIGALPVFESRLTGARFIPPITEYDITGTLPPVWIDFQGEDNLVVQPDDSLTLPLTGTFVTTASADELINKLIFKTNPGATLFGVRVQVVSQSTGLPIYYFPSKQKWEAGEGEDLIADGAGLVTIDITDSPIGLRVNQVLDNNYMVDSGVILGDGTTPYLEVDRQVGIAKVVVDKPTFDDNLAGTNNTTPFNPTENYHPATRKFVLDNITATLNYKGGYDAANNIPDLDVSPSGVMLGDFYTVTSNGTFFTANVMIGDAIIAEVDNASTEADWTILNRNLDAATIKVLYESNPDTNAFTDSEKTKLGNIEAGAEVNVQSDWNQTNTGADDYIKNKPSIGAALYLSFGPNDALFPGSNPASAFSRNGHPILAFDASTAEKILFGDNIQSGYAGEDIKVDIEWVAKTATTGGVTWGVEFERNTPGGNDIDSDSFAAQQTGNSTTAGNSGVITRTTITLTQAQADGLIAGDYFRMRFERVTGDGGDNMSGDAQILRAVVRV